MRHGIPIAVLVSVLCVRAAYAGWLGDVAAGTGFTLGERAARESAEGVYETAKDSLMRRLEKPVAGLSSMDPPGGRGVARGRVGGEGAASWRGGIRPAEVTAAHAFIPCERILFFDDFRDSGVGGFPGRWTFKGPDSNRWKTPVEVAGYGGRRWVRYRPSNERKDALTALYARVDAGKDLPETFTVEFDAVFPPYDGTDQRPEYRVLLINHNSQYRGRDYDAAGSNVVRIGSYGASSGTTKFHFERADGQVHRVSIRVEGRHVRAYLDEEMVVNDPAGIVRPVTVVGMELAFQTGADILPLMFTDFRLAAAGTGESPR